MIGLPAAIQNFLANYATSHPSTGLEKLHLLVGVSGGPDSVALLHALCTLQNSSSLSLSLDIQVAHLNHLMRGDNARQDADYVSNLCQQLQVKCHSAEYDVPRFAAQEGLSLEDAARRVRFAFFVHLIQRERAPLLLLAHTASDQAETVLLHLLRGTGPHGLAGIAPFAPLPPIDPALTSAFEIDPARLSEGLIGRPLLGLWREEIEAYCIEQKLSPRYDETNADLRYTRNRIRHDLLPRLQTDYSPAVKNNLVRLANLLRDEQEWLDQLTEVAFQGAAHFEPDGRIEFELDSFQRQPVALQRRLLRRAYLALAGSLENLGAGNIEPLIVRSEKQISLFLPGGLYGYSNTQVVGIRKPPTIWQPFAPMTLAIPGIVLLKQGWQIEAQLVPAEEIGPEELKAASRNNAYLDYELTGPHLLVRPRQPGEKFQPLGAPGRRKLQDMMTDAKIAREKRNGWPLVVRPAEEGIEQEIVWLPGVAFADNFKVTKLTKKIVVLTFTQV